MFVKGEYGKDGIVREDVNCGLAYDAPISALAVVGDT